MKMKIKTTLLISKVAIAQVGINTDVPNATLDVRSSASNLTKTDGLIHQN